MSQDDLRTVWRNRLGPRYRVSGGGPPGSAIEYLSDDHYFVIGEEGEIFDLEVSKASFDKLYAIHRRIGDAFEHRNI